MHCESDRTRYDLCVMVPRPIPNDPRLVVEALEAAENAWPIDRVESIVWIRKAAHDAEKAGLAERGLELALAAAELLQRVSESSVMPTGRAWDPKAVTIEMEAVGKKKR